MKKKACRVNDEEDCEEGIITHRVVQLIHQNQQNIINVKTC